MRDAGRGDGEMGGRGDKKEAVARAACASPPRPVPPSPRPLKEGEDFYREGGYVVFTARYHLRRGYCCESGCRHCPYGADSKGVESDEEKRDE